MKPNTASTGPLATKFFPHPLDPNMGATFDGRLWTRYVAHKRGGVVGEWRELTKFAGPGSPSRKSYTNTSLTQKRSTKNREMVTCPNIFSKILGRKTSKFTAGRLFLECYLGRSLESWEVCRHGIAGPNDHSYLNVSPGDAVNNMIDDLETGKSETNLTYLIQAKNRIERLISGCAFTNQNHQ